MRDDRTPLLAGSGCPVQATCNQTACLGPRQVVALVQAARLTAISYGRPSRLFFHNRPSTGRHGCEPVLSLSRLLFHDFTTYWATVKAGPIGPCNEGPRAFPTPGSPRFEQGNSRVAATSRTIDLAMPFGCPRNTPAAYDSHCPGFTFLFFGPCVCDRTAQTIGSSLSRGVLAATVDTIRKVDPFCSCFPRLTVETTIDFSE